MPFIYFLEMLILAAAWGIAFYFMRASGHEFGPVAFIFMRTLTAAIVLTPCLLSRNIRRAIKSHWWPITVVGVLNSVIPFILFSYATLSLQAGLTSIINGTAPIFGAIVGALWLRQQLDGLKILGIAISFAGVIALVALQGLDWQYTVLPILSALGGSLLYGVAACYNKKYLVQVPPLAIAAGSQWMSAIILLPAGLLLWPQHTISATAWSHVIALGAVSTAFAYILYFHLIQQIGAIKAITVAYLVPVFGVLWGILLLDESLSLTQGISSIIVLIGVILTTGVTLNSRAILTKLVKSR